MIRILLIILLPLTLIGQTYRDSIDVINYSINLEVSVEKKNINGFTELTLRPKYPNISSIALDFLSLTVDKIMVNGYKTNRWIQTDTNIRIIDKHITDSNKPLKIKIYYHGKPTQDKTWGGFYFRYKNAFNLGVAFEQTPHSFARVWFPANDIFTDKATFEYKITVKKPYTAVCGGKLIKQINNDNYRTFVYKLDLPIPPYLASVNVGIFDTITGIYHGIERDIPYRIFVLKGKKQLAKETFKNLDSAIKIFEKLFGPYPWDLVGYSEINIELGAMEHVENIAMTNLAINGTLKDETLLYHELAHSWFGDLVTCKTAKDIWLNESWAEYSEALFLENLYGKDAANNHLRKSHFYAINFAHKNDYGYRALANMDTKFTYGTTIYKKGPGVVHTLRYYLGDSLFFKTLKAYLKHFAFKTATTEDMLKFFSDFSSVNLIDFFNLWIYTKGFPFFEIQKWQILDSTNNKYTVQVSINQRFVGNNFVGKNIKIPISFFNKKMQRIDKQFISSNKNSKDTFYLQIKPVYVALDIDQWLADATTDQFYFVKDTGLYIFDEELADIYVEQIDTTSLIRVQNNWIEPDNIEKIYGYLFQKNFYWTVEGIWNKNLKAKLRLYLTTLMDMNFTYLHKPKEFILFYRKNKQQKWQPIDFQLVNNDYLETTLQPGDYAIAIKTYE